MKAKREERRTSRIRSEQTVDSYTIIIIIIMIITKLKLWGRGRLWKESLRGFRGPIGKQSTTCSWEEGGWARGVGVWIVRSRGARSEQEAPEWGGGRGGGATWSQVRTAEEPGRQIR